MPASTHSSLQTLRGVFGHERFRPGQEAIVEAILAGEDVFAILPSGAGKSLCYQLPAVLRPGLTVVVSPLIALMRDQVTALRARGVATAMLSSGNDDEEDRLAHGGLRRGDLRLLYLSPELFSASRSFALLERVSLRCLVIDEAHCIAHWGKDFRPEYREIGGIADELAARHRSGRLQRVAMTATADEATRGLIAENLFAGSPRMFVQSFDRPNIHLAFPRKRAADRQMLALVRAHPGATGILYCSTRRRTEAMAAVLQGAGVRAFAYHAGLERGQRAEIEARFRAEAALVIVATIAFGMGVDRADVRYVGHVDTPASVESYYQEIGRAGRDGQPAWAVALVDPADLRVARAGLDLKSEPGAALLRHRSLTRLCLGGGCRRVALLAAFGEASRPCGRCDRCEAGPFGRIAARLGLA